MSTFREALAKKTKEPTGGEGKIPELPMPQIKSDLSPQPMQKMRKMKRAPSQPSGGGGSY